MKPLFITFEGIDFSGKSTQIRLLENFFSEQKIKFISTREPGGTPVSEKIRKILLDKENKISAYTELLLFLSARKQHLDKKIIPALQNNICVLCDRFLDSTLVYQSVIHHIETDNIKNISQLAQIDCPVDLTVLLDLPAEIAEKRINQFGERNRMELFSLEVVNQMRMSFLNLAENEPERFLVVNATLPVEEIHHKITKQVKKNMKG